MKGQKVLKVFLVLLVAVFVFHQIYSSTYKPIVTESAVYHETVEGLNITGYIIRNEQTVENSSSGVLHYVTSDGSRVARDGIIADIYDTETASITMSEIKSVSEQIADITQQQSYNNLKASDLELVNSKVKEAINELVQSCADGNFDSTSGYEEALLSAMNRRQLVTGEQTDFSERLSALNERLEELKKALPESKGSIKAGESGYFVSVVDGYEDVLTCDSLDSVTPDFLKNLKPHEVSGKAIGKIVSDYEWYIAAKVTINDSLKYKVGDRLTVNTQIKLSPSLPVTVKQINMSDNGESAVIILSCNQMSSELATMRTGTMTIVSNTYKGLRVARSALRVVDSETGVYVLSGITLKFVPVNVIYSTDEYIICEQQQSDKSVLRLYDDVVVKGKKLYEGKVIG